jgi:rhodanese-related sulfurtransferase
MFDWITGRRADAELTADELQRRLVGADAPFLIDVREPAEFSAGHVPGAVPLPLGQVAARLGELPGDREIAVLCRSGARSAQATAILRTGGLRATNVAGGMLAWRGPVARGPEGRRAAGPEIGV